MGVRYLSEGKYEEAIIAFTAAIEINPNRAEAYVGRGDAYVASGNTEENLAAALADYEAALELDETLVDAWLGLTNVYINWEDHEMVLEALQNSLAATDDAGELQDMMEEYERMRDGFYSSDEFEDFSTLSHEAQDLISSLLEAFVAGEPAIVENIMEKHDIIKEGILSGGGDTLRTELQNYKLQLDGTTSSFGYSTRIEVRPENGTAYAAQYEYDITDAGTRYHTIYITGGCSNWNWNGTYERRNYNSGPTVEQEWIESGSMKDCLADGVIYTTYTQSNIENPSISENSYEYGRIIPQDGIIYSSNTLNKYDSPIWGSLYDDLDTVKLELWWD